MPIPIALSGVGLIGYVVGRWRKSRPPELSIPDGSRELRRAEHIVREFKEIGREVRSSLFAHHMSVSRFRRRVGQLRMLRGGNARHGLSKEVERLLEPTLKLSSRLARLQDEFRQQTNLLLQFTEVRIDPLTEFSNRRAMEEWLTRLCALHARYRTPFSLAMLDLDHFKSVNDRLGHLQGDQALRQFAQSLAETARETDLPARFGGEEFVVAMPQTDLDGACVRGERLRQKVERELSLTVSVGVTEAQEDDTMQSLLSRADAALYAAKDRGRNCVFRHTGHQIERVDTPSGVSPAANRLETSHDGSARSPEIRRRRVPTGETACHSAQCVGRVW